MRPRLTRASRTPRRGFATLGELIDSLAEHGARPAVRVYARHNASELSYAELASAVEHATRVLHARGVGPDTRVGLWAPNSVEWILAYFAIVRLGATAVPFDHQSSAESLAPALVHADLRLLLTTRSHRDELGAMPLPRTPECMLVDEGDWRNVQATRALLVPNALPTIESTAVAALLFTSGTTGTPKAVPLTHGNLASNTEALVAARLVAEDDRVLLPLPLHHTYPFTVGLLTSLATGATVILPSGISGSEILHACKDGHATALLAVPRLCQALWDSVAAQLRARGTVMATAFRLLLGLSTAVTRFTNFRLGRYLFRAVHLQLGQDLGVIGCGGAKLPSELAAALTGLGWTVLTGYGLTETSPVVTFNSQGRARLGSEGRPLPGVEVRIAGATADTPGEILVRGPSVFGGYWRNDAATRAAFTSDGWFRTGDLGRFDRAGFLFVVGRSKELIVLADGKKLFPETVEAAYAVCPLVKEIAVFEHLGTLAALVVPDEDAVRARGALREMAALREDLEEIAARLPPYQRLTAYRVTRAALPRTQLGKLRRHLLPELFAAADRPAPAGAPVVLSGEDSELLATRQGEVWRWLLQRFPQRSLTLDTSPQLDLAIDSLEWVTLTIELERRFGVTLDSATLSGILTLRDLLRVVAMAPTAAPTEHTIVPSFAPPGIAMRVIGACLIAPLRLVVRTLWPVRVTGLENLPPGPLLITPNHTSFLDPLVLIAALPWSRLRDTYWAGWTGVMYSNAVRRFVSRATGVFPVDPNHDLAAAVGTARSLLGQGHTVVWFPEGRRSPTGELGAFLPGVGLILKTSGAVAIPAAISGAFAIWPKQRRFPRLGPVQVRFGVALKPAPEDSAAPIGAALENAVRQLLGDTPATDPRAQGATWKGS